jgi:dipeptidase E
MWLGLAGGGDVDDSRLQDEAFAARIGPRGRVLYWPIAMRGMRPLESCLDWIRAAFAPLNVTDITLWSDLAAHRVSELDAFDALFIGGGNTFSLLHEIRQSGFEDGLKAYVRSGKVVYGGSAGAVIWGRDIQTVNHLDRNDAHLSNTEGLDMAEGHAIWVHYRPEDDARIRTHMETHRYPVLALSERTGIIIETTGMRTVGFDPVFRFDGLGKSMLKSASGPAA